jgi:hypothetical protein
MRANVLTTLIMSTLVIACSDSSDNNGSISEPVYSVDPTTIDVSQADYCDITQTANCMFPFPNDFFTREDPATPTGKRLNLAPLAMPVNVAGVPVDPSEYNRNDGFSIGPTLLTHVEGIDLEVTGAASIVDMGSSLDANAPIQLIHAQSGERQLIWAEIDQVPAEGEPRSLMIRIGKSLRNGERYIVVMQNLLDSAGEPLEPGDAFKVYQEAIPSDVPELEIRREHFDSLFDSLEGFGFER